MSTVAKVFVVLNLLLAGGPKGVRALSSPSSGRARPGATYPARLLSRCTPAVDFDGSYWGPSGLFESRTATTPGRLSATSTQLFAPPPLRSALRHLARSMSIWRRPISSPSP